MPKANDQDATGSGRPSGGDALDGRRYAEAILRTMRQPLIVLLGDLSIETANGAFYRTFEVEPGETEGRPLYELGDGQWEIPKLRDLLERILPESGEVEDFRVEHDFERIGRRIMLLNAYRMRGDGEADRSCSPSTTSPSGSIRAGCSRARRSTPRRSLIPRATLC